MWRCPVSRQPLAGVGFSNCVCSSSLSTCTQRRPASPLLTSLRSSRPLSCSSYRSVPFLWAVQHPNNILSCCFCILLLVLLLLPLPLLSRRGCCCCCCRCCCCCCCFFFSLVSVFTILLLLLMLLLLVVLSGVHCSPDPRQVSGNVYLQPLGMKLVAVGVLMPSAFSASCMSIVIISSC